MVTNFRGLGGLAAARFVLFCVLFYVLFYVLFPPLRYHSHKVGLFV